MAGLFGIFVWFCCLLVTIFGGLVWLSKLLVRVWKYFANPRKETVIYLVFPITINSIGAVFFFWIYPEFFSDDWASSYLVALAAAASGLWVVVAFFIHEIGPLRAIFSLVCQALAIITIYAGIYRGFGLNGDESFCGVVPKINALYFSIVTWTTLGYGDYSPPDEIKLLAAFQASLGYIFLGLIVGLLVNLLSQHAKKDGERQDETDRKSEARPDGVSG